MLATRDLLQRPVGAGTRDDGFGWDASICEVEFDGQPPPICGELFIAIHEGAWSGEYIEGRKDRIGVEITITRRIAAYPVDRGKTPLLEAADALHVWIEKIAAKVHMNYNVLDMAGGTCVDHVWTGGKSYSLTATENGFAEPLYFTGCAGKTEKKGPDWFMADPSENVDNAPLGIARTLVFGNAVRYQSTDSQS
jgi:hypothetical protein